MATKGDSGARRFFVVSVVHVHEAQRINSAAENGGFHGEYANCDSAEEFCKTLCTKTSAWKKTPLNKTTPGLATPDLTARVLLLSKETVTFCFLLYLPVMSYSVFEGAHSVFDEKAAWFLPTNSGNDVNLDSTCFYFSYTEKHKANVMWAHPSMDLAATAWFCCEKTAAEVTECHPYQSRRISSRHADQI